MAVYGDTSGTLSGHQQGKGQRLQGTGEIYGDLWLLDGDARGGNDMLVVAAGGSFSELFGDAHYMEGDARGGNDTLQGAVHEGADHTTRNWMRGDAQVMVGNAVGGMTCSLAVRARKIQFTAMLCRCGTPRGEGTMSWSAALRGVTI